MWYKHFPYAYAHYYYYYHTRKELNWKHPTDFNQKLFWLSRYWQDERIVRCSDKLMVRDYVKSLGLEDILTHVIAVYNSADEIDFSILPPRYVLKTNHLGGGSNVIICLDNDTLDVDKARQIISDGLKKNIGWDTCEYHYLFIKPRVMIEEYIDGMSKYEIQFFCFNGEPRHILVRNDLGIGKGTGFAISYDMNWNRVNDRKNEDMSLDITKPKQLNQMIEIARRLSTPFPQVRIDLYLCDERIYFGEMTFTTSGNILTNYREETIKRWGEELILPSKLKTRWRDIYKT